MKEFDDALEKYRLAVKEEFEASQEETKSMLRKKRAHHELLLIKDVLRGLEQDMYKERK